MGWLDWGHPGHFLGRRDGNYLVGDDLVAGLDDRYFDRAVFRVAGYRAAATGDDRWECIEAGLSRGLGDSTYCNGLMIWAHPKMIMTLRKGPCPSNRRRPSA